MIGPKLLVSILAIVCVIPLSMAVAAEHVSKSMGESPGDCWPDGALLESWTCGHLRGAMPPGYPEGGPGPGEPQPESPWTDVLHTRIDIDIAPTPRTISGVITITGASRIAGLNQFVVYLDPTGGAMNIASVGGNATGFSQLDDKVTLTLDGVYNVGQQFTVTVAYGGSPTNGIYWGSHNNGTSNVDILATLSEPFSARGWWPGKDVLDDKSTFDLWLTVPNGYIAASNGVLEGTDAMPGGKTRFRWHVSYPMIPYLASLAIGDYQVYSTTYTHLGDVMPMSFYILPERYAQWQSYCNTYVTQTEVFSDKYGQYPFILEKGGMAHTPTLGGTYMEHQTLPSMPNFNVVWINAHELAHQWWGDNITCETWGDIWLNEGFASYSEAIWEQYRPGGGDAGYHTRMQQRRPSNTDARVYVSNVNNVGAIFSGTVYSKGAWVLHMLRHVLGEGTFFQSLLDYRGAFQGDSATTAEFAASISTTAGFDLSFFTNQWVMTAGSPDYAFSWAGVNQGGQEFLMLRLEQTQGSRGYALMSMPVDVRVTTTAGNSTSVVWCTAADDRFVIPLPAAATQVQIDPDSWILTHSVTEATYAAGVSYCQGDMNEDGAVDGRDISLFTQAMIAPTAGPALWKHGDMNYSGRSDQDDLTAFVQAVLAAAPCPGA